MPWRELDVMSQREEFVLRALHDGGSFVELCREYGIAPKTGYKWKRRFLQFGRSGLKDDSRRPRHSPKGLEEWVVCQIIRLRQMHPTWGARKLQWVYQKAHGSEPAPSESSFKRVLDRAGLVQRVRRRAVEQTGRIQQRLVAQAPNELWTADFKGWWYTAKRERCEPLTVRDAFSRYVLGVRIPPSSRTETIRGEFERLFAEYGLPGTIRSDNGQPFAASGSPLGLSRLSAWWLALGINLDRTDPGHPQQNGSHERMHRDIAVQFARLCVGRIDVAAAAFVTEAE